MILNELCNSIIKNCHIGTLTEGKYLEGWCFSGGDSVEWVLYKEGSAYEGGGANREGVYCEGGDYYVCLNMDGA